MIKPFDMNELLDTMARLVSTQFKITSLANLYARRLDPSKTFTVLWELMKRMFREGTDMVVFSEDYGLMINFFERSIEISRQGGTILCLFRSSHSDRFLIDQLLEITDAHLSMSIEDTLKNYRLETFAYRAVRKIDGIKPIPSRGVAFRVNSRLIKLENRSLEALTGIGLAL